MEGTKPMQVKYGEGKTVYGPGVSIEMSGDELALAVMTWLMAQDVHVFGARTVTVNGELCERSRVYVDPSGFVMTDGERMDGRGPLPNGEQGNG